MNLKEVLEKENLKLEFRTFDYLVDPYICIVNRKSNCFVGRHAIYNDKQLSSAIKEIFYQYANVDNINNEYLKELELKYTLFKL